MKDNTWHYLMGIIVGLAVGYTAGFLVSEVFCYRAAIEKGYAEHSPETGKWQWKEATK